MQRKSTLEPTIYLPRYTLRLDTLLDGLSGSVEVLGLKSLGIQYREVIMAIYEMDDVGTRLQHAMDLYDTWGACLANLTSPGYHNPTEIERAEQLTNAMKLLANYMGSEYSPTYYARVINDLPKDARDIKD